jgi:hypothetical protein
MPEAIKSAANPSRPKASISSFKAVSQLAEFTGASPHKTA